VSPGSPVLRADWSPRPATGKTSARSASPRPSTGPPRYDLRQSGWTMTSSTLEHLPMVPRSRSAGLVHMLRRRLPGLPLGAFVAAVYLFLYLPAIVIALYSFNSSPVMSWPPTGFSLHWYRQAFADNDLMTGLRNSVEVAAVSVALAVLLGVPAGVGFDRFS